MELEGLRRGIDYLEDNGLEITQLITDRHKYVLLFICYSTVDYFFFSQIYC